MDLIVFMNSTFALSPTVYILEQKILPLPSAVVKSNPSWGQN
jgi:hypothetical protein